MLLVVVEPTGEVASRATEDGDGDVHTGHADRVLDDGV